MPSIKVNILGNAGSLKTAAKESEGALGQLGGKAHELKGLLLGAFGAAGVIELGKTIVEATNKEEAANASLRVAIKDSGASFGQYKDRIEAAGKSGEKFGYTTAETNQTIAKLTIATGSTAKALKLLGLSQDVATAKHVSLAAASLLVVKASEGQTRVLKSLGVDLPLASAGAAKLQAAHLKLAAAEQAVALVQEKIRIGVLKGPSAYFALTAAQGKAKAAQEGVNRATIAGDTIIKKLTEKLHGQAAAASETFAGKMRSLKVTVEDAEAKIGEKLIPIIEKLITLMLVGFKYVGKAWDLLLGGFQNPDAKIGANVNKVSAFFIKLGATVRHIVDAAIAFWNKYGDTIKRFALNVVIFLGKVGLVVAETFGKFVHFLQGGSAAANVLKVILGSLGAAMLVVAAVTKTVALATQIWTKAQAALDVAMDASPITLAVAAVIALGVAIYEAYKHFKPFHDAVDDAWQILQAVFHWVTDHWKLLGEILLAPLLVPIVLIVATWKKVTAVFTATYDWVKAHWPLITGILTLGLSTAITWIVDNWGKITNVFSTVIDWVKTNWIHILAWLILPFVGAAVEVTRHWDGIVSFFQGLGGRIISAVGDAGKLLLHAGEAVLAGLLSGAKTGWTHFWSWVVSLGKTIIEGFKAAPGWLVNAGQAVISGLLSGAKTAWNTYWSWEKSLGTLIISAFTAAPGWLLGAGRAIISGLYHGATVAWGTVITFFTSLPGRVTTAVGNSYEWLYNVGRNVITGFLHGIQAAWSDLTGWISTAFHKLPGFVQKILGVFSPSKVFHAIGFNTMEGYRLGLQSSWLNVTRDVSKMAGQLGNSFGPIGLSAPGVAAANQLVASGASAQTIGGPGVSIVNHFPAGVDPAVVAAAQARYVRRNGL